MFGVPSNSIWSKFPRKKNQRICSQQGFEKKQKKNKNKRSRIFQGKLFKNKAPGNAFNPFLGSFLTPRKKKKNEPEYNYIPNMFLFLDIYTWSWFHFFCMFGTYCLIWFARYGCLQSCTSDHQTCLAGQLVGHGWLIGTLTILYKAIGIQT